MLGKAALTLALTAVSAVSVPKASAALVADSPCITNKEMDDAMHAWGGALVGIGAAFRKGGCKEAKAAAQGALDVAYGYNHGYTVLFKPTLTSSPHTFRPTVQGALSYFVGPCAGEKDWLRQDGGFALGYSATERDDLAVKSNTASNYQGFEKPVWSEFTYINSTDPNDPMCQTPLAQGKLTITSVLTQNTSTVDKTFAYKRSPSPKNTLPILLVTHHSSEAMEKPCEDWCADHTHTWSYKCVHFDRCLGCKPC